jgi:Ribbon-helix-helix protein, copG family
MGTTNQKHQPHQPKQSHKGQKCIRGQSLYYDELKKRITLTLTPTVIKKLSVIADEQGLSRSEYLERLIREM